MGRFGSTHAGSCLFVWSWLLFYLKVTLQTRSLQDTAKSNFNSHKCERILFAYWTVYRRLVILSAKAKLILYWARFSYAHLFILFME